MLFNFQFSCFILFIVLLLSTTNEAKKIRCQQTGEEVSIIFAADRHQWIGNNIIIVVSIVRIFIHCRSTVKSRVAVFFFM
jgi:hypothetical protein